MRDLFKDQAVQVFNTLDPPVRKSGLGRLTRGQRTGCGYSSIVRLVKEPEASVSPRFSWKPARDARRRAEVLERRFGRSDDPKSHRLVGPVEGVLRRVG